MIVLGEFWRTEENAVLCMACCELGLIEFEIIFLIEVYSNNWGNYSRDQKVPILNHIGYRGYMEHVKPMLSIDVKVPEQHDLFIILLH